MSSKLAVFLKNPQTMKVQSWSLICKWIGMMARWSSGQSVGTWPEVSGIDVQMDRLICVIVSSLVRTWQTWNIVFYSIRVLQSVRSIVTWVISDAMASHKVWHGFLYSPHDKRRKVNGGIPLLQRGCLYILQKWTENSVITLHRQLRIFSDIFSIQIIIQFIYLTTGWRAWPSRLKYKE